MTNESGFPRNTHVEHNGMPFRQFDIDGGHILLTPEGNQLLHDKDVLERLRKYIEEIQAPEHNPESPSRIYLRQGGNAFIYLLGDLPLAVKEMSNSKSAESALARLAVLQRAAKNFPSYVQVPLHYGALSSTRLGKEYLLMDKINDGLNVMDILEQPERFGDAGSLAVAQYHQAKGDIERALINQGLDPEEYMSDWKEENVLVDFSRPVASLPFTLWLIDQ